MTAEQVQVRRDTEGNLTAATPASGELGWDTTNERLVVGNGSTAGGKKVTMAADLQKQTFLAGTVGGTADAITLTNSPAYAALTSNMKVVLKATSDNTAAVTLAVDGLTAKDVKKMVDGTLTALEAGDIQSGGIYDLFYDGTQFQIKGLDEGSTPTGLVLQTANSLSSSTATALSEIPLDNSIPQNTEGTEFTSGALAFTPVSASSTLLIEVWAFLGRTSAATATATSAALFVDTTANALAAGVGPLPSATSLVPIYFTYSVASGSTVARTYKLRFGGTSVKINANDSGAIFGGVMKSGIRVTETL